MEAEMYGIFEWRGDGKYYAADAVKIYKSKNAADKYADKLNGPGCCNVEHGHGGWVVRPV